MSKCGPGEERCGLVHEFLDGKPTRAFLSCPNHATRHAAVDTLVEGLREINHMTLDDTLGWIGRKAEIYRITEELLIAAGEVVDE